MGNDELTCPTCRENGSLIIQSGGLLYCRECGMFFKKEEAKSLQNVPVLGEYNEVKE